MASVLYNNYREELANGNIDFTNDTIKIMLVTTTYTVDIDTHAFRSDVTGEASGSGYTSGGTTLSSVTVTQDNTNNRANIDAADVTFSAITVTNVDGAIVYKSTGAAATDILIAYIDFTEGAQTINSGDFAITFDSSGILTV